MYEFILEDFVFTLWLQYAGKYSRSSHSVQSYDIQTINNKGNVHTHTVHIQYNHMIYRRSIIKVMYTHTQSTHSVQSYDIPTINNKGTVHTHTQYTFSTIISLKGDVYWRTEVDRSNDS